MLLFPFSNGEIDASGLEIEMMFYLNLYMYICSCLLCFGIFVIMAQWCYYIDRKESQFAFLLYLGMGGIKLSLAILWFANILQMLINRTQPTLWTLGPRILFLIFVSLHFYLLIRVRPSEMNLVIFRKKDLL